MPFTKTGSGRYTHKGRSYTEKQVKAYYATDGFKRKPKKGKSKGYKAMDGLRGAKP